MKTYRNYPRPHTARRFVALLSIALLAGASSVALSRAAERPEHPTKSASGSDMSGVTPSTDVSLEDIAKFAEGYVAKQSKGGAFSITDKAAGNKKLALKLDHVHRDRLSQVAPDMYFVCADFKTTSGAKTYDLDFFVQGTSANNLKVVPNKTTVHKEDGKPRYNWALNESTKVWEQKPVNGQPAPDSATKAEHPEHPKKP